MPYLRPDWDDDGGYFVTCPGCGERFYAPDGSEDDTTKTANRTAAEHYEHEHLAS